MIEAAPLNGKEPEEEADIILLFTNQLSTNFNSCEQLQNK